MPRREKKQPDGRGECLGCGQPSWTAFCDKCAPSSRTGGDHADARVRDEAAKYRSIVRDHNRRNS